MSWASNPGVRLAALSVAIVAVLAGAMMWVTGRDGSEKPATLVGGSAPTSPTPAPLSGNCKLAVLNWVEAAGAQHADIVFGAPDHASDKATTTEGNKITAFCPAGLQAKVAQVDYMLVLDESRLMTHAKVPGGDESKIRREIEAVRAYVR